MSAWTVIGYNKLTSSQSTIQFASIPQTYTDLVLVICGRNTNGVDDNEIVQLRFNSDSGSNYANRSLLGTGSSSLSQTLGTNYINAARCPSAGRTANTFSNITAYIPNYRLATAKSVNVEGVEENNGTTAIQVINAGLWNSSNAITSITLSFGAGSFMQHSSATLYGITAGSSGGISVS